MKLDQPQLQSQLAGEYVLGTLRGAARQRFETYLARSVELQEAVKFWENALAPLAQLEPVAPSADILSQIEKRLGWQAEKPANAWRLPWLPSLAFALVATFSILLWAPWQTRIIPDFALSVATAEGAGRWQMAVDKTHNWIDIRVLQTPDLASDKDLELWLLVDNAAPISLGLVSEQDGQIQRIKASIDLSAGSGLAVSLEPMGGSPTGAPTGPVLAAEMFPSA